MKTKMKNKYKTTFTSLCPNNNEVNNYVVIFKTNDFVMVEDIIKYLKYFKDKKIYQEDIAKHLILKFHGDLSEGRRQVFKGSIILIGNHGGVEITTKVSNV